VGLSPLFCKNPTHHLFTPSVASDSGTFDASTPVFIKIHRLMRHFFTSCLLLCAALASAQISYYVKFPNDLITNICDPQQPYGEPQFFNPQGLALTFSYSDQFFYTVPDACYRIERTWIVKGPNYDPALPCVVVPNPNPNATVNSPANLPGPVLSPSSNPNVVAAPWTATRVAITPGAPQVDYAVYYNGGTYNWNGQSITVPNVANVNCYEYKQIIKVIDNTPPALLGCPSNTLLFQDKSLNDPKLWNAPYWLDPQSQSKDLNEWAASISLSVTDDCPGNTPSGQYELHLDTDQNGTQETVILSGGPPPPGTVNFDNYLNPNYSGGTPQVFDQRSTQVSDLYQFGVFSTLNPLPNPARTFFVGWHTQAAPDDWVLPELPYGTHKIKWVISDNCGNEMVCTYFFTIAAPLSNAHTLRGQVVADLDGNCAVGSNEPVLKSGIVRLDRLRPDGSLLTAQYSSIGSDSQYLFLVDTGRYRLTVLPPNAYWSPCSDILLTVNTIGDTTQADFSAKLAASCAHLDVDIGTPFLRRCFDNTYTVRYCNTGTVAAEDAFVRVKLDPFMSFVSASQPAVFEGDHTWRFNIGHIPVNRCSTFVFTAKLGCSAVLGQSHCVEARIYPDSFCIAPALWSGANVSVSGVCLSDSVRFTLRNTGKAATSPLEYRIIRDSVMVGKAPFQLPAGGQLKIHLPANGSTWRLEAEQEPGNLISPQTSATVEACGKNAQGGFSTGFASQFAESDTGPYISIDCQQNIGAYDPNDKQGWPLGYGPNRFIEEGQPLDYLIRFQNTGTDTAFTVVVLDTLAEWLDPASIAPGASSHAYQFALSGQGILSFRFENILLPDSNVNEAASHGFVKFRVKQRDAVPLGTAITNRAAIYFDFNAPVITNETQHRVGKDFVAVATAQSDYYVKFPDDLLILNCGTQPTFTPPQLFNTHGANVTMDYTDENITVVPDACYRIERTWAVKSVGYDPALPCIQVPNPNPNATINNPANFLGPVVSPAGTPAPWAPTEAKLLPSDPMPTNFSTYWSSTANCYQYKQIIKILDLTDPTISCVPASTVFADSTANDPQFWNAPYWLDAVNNSHDLSDVAVDLNMAASDDCSGTNLQVRYLLFLDLDFNGTFETVVDSRNPPAAGQVNFYNAPNPNFTGGTPQDFDQRPVDPALKYRFGLRREVVDGKVVASVGWHTEQDPDVWVLPKLPPGQHKISWRVEDACGNEQACEHQFKVVANEPPSSLVRTLRGRVFWDKNEDCKADPDEPTPAQWSQFQFYSFTPDGTLISTETVPLGPDGTYEFLLKKGYYSLFPLLPNAELWHTPCGPNGLTVNTVGDTSHLDFAVQPKLRCPLLQTDLSTARLRPCADNTYTLRYCNAGTITATDAYLRVRLDRFLSLVSASLPAVDEGNRYWRFDLGNLPAQDCGSLQITARLDCDSLLPGQTFCSEAHIYPDTACVKFSPPIPIFGSGGLLELDGACSADSVRFTVRNPDSLNYVSKNYWLIQDAQVVRSGKFDLLPGDSTHLSVPADGSTWRLQISYLKGIPLTPDMVRTLSATVEACGRNSAGGISTGFVSQLPEDDWPSHQSVDCQQTGEYFLPNDKQGYPLGYGPDHLIEQGQPIDYIIRFQNLGTDTARRVVVIDTLSSWLYAPTVTPGASSHPYRYEMPQVGVMRFTFEDINLPSWAENEVASHGFVKFRAFQRGVSNPAQGAPLGTLITNRAALIFDEKTPVLTPTTRHRIGQNFVNISAVDGPGNDRRPEVLRVWPNPVPQAATTLWLENLTLKNTASAVRFDLYDARGRHVLSRPVQGERASLEGERLPSGLYFFQVFEEGKMRGAGKVVME